MLAYVSKFASNYTTMDSKTIALVSYLTIIGWIIAIVNHSNNKTALAAFHIRQSLGVFLTFIVWYVLGIVLYTIMPFGMWGIVSLVIGLGQLTLLGGLIMGIIAANNEEQKPLPVLGDFYQNLLKGIG